MYYSQPIIQTHATPLLYYYYPTTLIYYHSQNHSLTVTQNVHNYQHNHLEYPFIPNQQRKIEKDDEIIKEKGQTYDSFSQLQIKPKSNRKYERPIPTPNYSISTVKQKEVKLSYRIEWRNQNRNIVPNLINQMISFLLKQSKSMKLTRGLFHHHPHPQEFTLPRYFQYVKKIKQSVTHYVNQSVFLHFFQIHEPNCQLYALEEQQFYMKICRIVILSFLRNEIKLISLTSKRMSQAKRKTHLIARQALENKFLQLCQQQNTK